MVITTSVCDKKVKTINDVNVYIPELTPDGVLPLEQNDSTQSSNLNISDVIDAISRADPYRIAVFDAEVVVMPQHSMAHMGVQPYVRIVEQPAAKGLRFRYVCELAKCRLAGSIPGRNSTPEKKTYPTIEIRGHKGPAIIVVSCVTRDEPFKPHPHNLVSRERCKDGVCTIKINVTENNPQVSFRNLGIQCEKRKDIAESLRTRERLNVDPYRTGFSHRNQLQSIDLRAIRLCFQVFIYDEITDTIRRPLQPVVTDIIYDKKTMSDPYITCISHCSTPPKGGTEVILLCEGIAKKDIAVVFFEKDGDRVVWEETAHIVLVHRQRAVVFHTPPYRQPTTTASVQVFLQLKQTSDNERSNALPFEYSPDIDSDSGHIARKRQKRISSVLQHYDPNRNFQKQQIKPKPSKSPLHHLGSPLQHVLSPVYERESVQFQWPMQGPSLAGSSNVNYLQDVQWSPNYMQSISPNLPVMSPVMQQNLQTMSPNIQALSPNMQMSGMNRISVAHGGIAPNLGLVSLALPHPSPSMGHLSLMGHVSPRLEHVHLPGMEHKSPHLMQHSNWPMQGPSLAGSSNVNYLQDVQWSPNYMQSISPNLPVMSPVMQQNLQTMSPNIQALSPNMQMSGMNRISVAHGGIAPNLGLVSLALPHPSPSMGHLSLMGHVSPRLEHVHLPGMEHKSPHLMQHSNEIMELRASDTPSLSQLLQRRQELPQLKSDELSGLEPLLNHVDDLSDSLNRLSTNDLLH